MSEEQPQVIYVNKDSKYNVNNFTHDAKLAYSYLVEINQEVMTLTKRITILQAASVTLNKKIEEQLSDTDIIDDEAASDLADNKHLGY